MLYLAMAIQTVDLLLGDVFFVKQTDIRKLLCPVHVAEVAFVLGRQTVAPCDFHVALAAFIAGLQSCLMREGSFPVDNGLRWC